MLDARLPRSRRSFLLLVAISVFVLGACGGGASSPTPAPRSLEGTAWRATLIRDVAPVAGAEATIRFDRGQAGGTTGCNSYGGAYVAGAGGAFRIESMMMTEMACDGPRGTQETVVVDILSHADRLEFIDGHLKISGPSGSITFAEDPR